MASISMTLENKKILILGAHGMLGQVLGEIFSDCHPLLWGRGDLDITNKEEVEEKIVSVAPDIIINAAAYTNVDGAEEEEDLALRVNGDAAGYIAQVAKKADSLLVYISTDYVFNGSRVEGYDENERDFFPLNVYGESKLAGEQNIEEILDHYYIIRTSWLYGPGGKNFVTTMLQLANERDSLKVVNDQIGRPTFTRDLGKGIRSLLEDTPEYGIYHLTNSVPEGGGISWYDFAHEIFEIGGKEIEISPCSSEEFPRPAKRPHYSILLNTKRPELRDWRLGLQDYLSELL